MNKVTVKQFLDAGFEFSENDAIDGDGIPEFVLPINQSHLMDSRVTGVVWRKNTGSLPVDDFCQIVCKGNNGNEFKVKAMDAPWLSTEDKSSNGAHFALLSWKPDLDAIAQLDTSVECCMRSEMIGECECEKSVEWDNGKPCWYKHKPDSEYVYIGLIPMELVALYTTR